MAQRDGSAVDVDLRHVEAQLPAHRDGLGGKRLVGLNEVNVVDGHASFRHGLAGGGHGAHAHDLRVHTALAPADELGHGLQAIFLHSFAGSQDDGSRAIIDTRGIGRSDPLLALILGFLLASDLEGVYNFGIGRLGAHGEGAPQLGDTLSGDASLGIFVLLEVHHVPLNLHGDGDNLGLKLPGSLGGFGLLLGSGGELVLLLAGDAPDVVDIFRSGPHVVVVIGIPEAVLDHGVHQLLVAHAGTPAGIHRGKGSGAHVLSTTADNHVGVPGQDGTGALNERLHAGTADHAHGVGGNGIGNAGLDGDLAGHVLALGSGEDAAEHDLIHVLRLHTSAVQGLLDHNRAQLRSGSVLQTAAKGADGGTAAVHDIKIFHDVPPYL